MQIHHTQVLIAEVKLKIFFGHIILQLLKNPNLKVQMSKQKGGGVGKLYILEQTQMPRKSCFPKKILMLPLPCK